MAQQPVQDTEATRRGVAAPPRGPMRWESPPAGRTGVDAPRAASFPAPSASSAAGLEAGMLVAIAYLLGWFGGLLVYLLERRDVEVRFHAAQSMLIDLSLLGLAIAFWPVGLLLLGPLALLTPVGTGLVVGPVLLLIALLLMSTVGGAWVLRVALAVKGYRLEHVSLPVVGAVAERWAVRPV